MTDIANPIPEPLVWKSNTELGIKKIKESIGTRLGDERILFIADVKRAEIFISSKDGKSITGLATMPDVPTAIHLIEYARRIPTEKRSRERVWDSHHRFITYEIEGGDEGRFEHWFTVNAHGTYRLRFSPEKTQLLFELNDRPEYSVSLIAMHMPEKRWLGRQGENWPNFLGTQSIHVAMAIELIDIHARAMKRQAKAG